MIDQDTQDLSFWFERDPERFLDRISNLGEQALFEYVMERGCQIPDIDTIRQACPVANSETDRSEMLIEKAITKYRHGKAN